MPCIPHVWFSRNLCPTAASSFPKFQGSQSIKMDILQAFIFLVLAVVVATESTSTSEEKKALESLRSEVDSILTNDFMRRDEYLMRFLRAEGLNVKKATQRLESMLAWRKAQNIDNLMDEDFTKVEKCIPARWTGHDYGGRPSNFHCIDLWPNDNDIIQCLLDFAVLVSQVGSFETRRCVLAGHSELLFRYLILIHFEMAERLAANATDPTDGNQNISQIYFVGDVNRFNLREGACINCLSVLTKVAMSEKHFPSLFYKIIVINVPKIFDAVLKVTVPFLSKETTQSMKLYGYDKSEWGPILHKDVDINQLPSTLGGKKRLR